MNLRSGLFLASFALLTGCANATWTTFNKDQAFSGSDDHVTFMDAKQRTLISNIKTTENTANHSKETIRRFCAEPSPDALSAIAASMGLNLSVPNKGDLGYSQAFTEGAASIGLRTQSIQILRDITYRDCEAFINGGLTEFGLETLQRRFQSTLVAVLAIEQLTGVVKASAVALSGQAKGIDADALAAAIKLVDTAEIAAKTAQTNQEKADTAAKSAGAAFGKFKDANPDVKDIENPTDDLSKEYKKQKDDSADKDAKAVLAKAENTKRQADLTDARALRMAATSAGRSGSINAIIEPNQGQKSLDATSVEHVTKAVSKIVENTLSLGFGREFCPTLFGQIATGKAESLKVEPGLTLAATCINYLTQSVRILEIQNSITSKTSENIAKVIAMREKGGLTPEETVSLINALNDHAESKIPSPELAIYESSSPIKSAPTQMLMKPHKRQHE